MKILVIDDEPLDLFLTQKQLGLEFNVVGYNNPSEAIQWIKTNDFDVVLIDFYLGPISGDEMLERIIDVKGREFRAFLLTNFIDEKQIQQIKSKGFEDVIFKPVTIEKFKSHML